MISKTALDMAALMYSQNIVFLLLLYGFKVTA